MEDIVTRKITKSFKILDKNEKEINIIFTRIRDSEGNRYISIKFDKIEIKFDNPDNYEMQAKNFVKTLDEIVDNPCNIKDHKYIKNK